MIEIGKVNPRCVNCKDFVNMDVVLRKMKKYVMTDMSLGWYPKLASKLYKPISARSQWKLTSYQDYPAHALLYWLHYYDKIPAFRLLWLPLLGHKPIECWKPWAKIMSFRYSFSLNKNGHWLWASFQPITTRNLKKKWYWTPIVFGAVNCH